MLRGDELRHRALVARLHLAGFEVSELVFSRRTSSYPTPTPFELQHLSARSQFELDYFGELIGEYSGINAQRVSDINSAEAVAAARDLNPDLIVVFGTPILRNAWIHAFSGSLLGIHLGLSPYFRGSGTNIWPLSQGLPEAIGFTLMQLDAGVDTGQVIHQRRAEFVLGDSVHSVNCRLLQLMFKDISNLAGFPEKLARAKPQSREIGFLIKRDFMSEEALRRVYRNFSSGMVEAYLESKSERDANYPLVLEQAWDS